MPHSASFRSMQIYIRRRLPNGPPFRLFLSENYRPFLPILSRCPLRIKPSCSLTLGQDHRRSSNLSEVAEEKRSLFSWKNLRLKRFFFILSLSLSLSLASCNFLETKEEGKSVSFKIEKMRDHLVLVSPLRRNSTNRRI